MQAFSLLFTGMHKLVGIFTCIILPTDPPSTLGQNGWASCTPMRLNLFSDCRWIHSLDIARRKLTWVEGSWNTGPTLPGQGTHKLKTSHWSCVRPLKLLSHLASFFFLMSGIQVLIKTSGLRSLLKSGNTSRWTPAFQKRRPS